MNLTRRDWLRAAPVAAVPLERMPAQQVRSQHTTSTKQPNIVLIISDQFRWDCVGAMGLNPMNLTPNLDRIAQHGVLFRSAFSAQPVCAPARASIFTGQYPSRHGVWKNGLGLSESSVTLATELRKVGYSANYIGKWHLGPPESPGQSQPLGPVAPRYRGGFLDLWEAANVFEMTSHAYEGDLFDRDGKSLHFSGQYRVDFVTERARRFLHSAKSPFLLTVSYLEAHHQNDIDRFVPPKELEKKYVNPFVPPDLRPLPGS
jgi:arylsulfatase A-like enzyme